MFSKSNWLLRLSSSLFSFLFFFSLCGWDLVDECDTSDFLVLCTHKIRGELKS